MLNVMSEALPSKPLHAVALSDADASSALSFVAQKLYDTNNEKSMTPEERKSVERLGGRASDLETVSIITFLLYKNYSSLTMNIKLVHKVRSGQKVQDAVEDIIGRGINELRKAAFGEDAEDAKSLSWSREQAWAVLKQLAKAEEVGVLSHNAVFFTNFYMNRYHITMSYLTSPLKETRLHFAAWSTQSSSL